MRWLDQLKSGRLKVQTTDPKLDEIRLEIQRLQRRITLALVGVGCVVCAAILLSVKDSATTPIGPLPLSVWLIGALGAIAAVASLKSGRRRGR